MMRRIPSTLSRCTIILVALLLVVSFFPVYAFASNTAEDDISEELILTGDFEGTFELSQNKSKLFHIEGILPGDSWSGTIVIKNEAPEAMTARLLSINSNLDDNVLFNALVLEIRDGDNVIYSGSYNTGKAPISETYELASGESVTLEVTVTLPLNVGNELMNKKMDSTWVFEAFYTLGADKPQTGVDLLIGNTAGLYILWIVLLALIAAVIVTLRIRAIKKAQNQHAKEDCTK